MTINISDALVRTLKDSHKVATKATVVVNRKDPIYDLAITDGNVHIDASNKHRRTAEVKLADPTGELVPEQLQDLLHPLSGNEVWLYRGAYIPGIGDELCQLGSFIIKDSEVIDSGAGLNITLKLIDRSILIARDRLANPIGTVPGSHIGTVIRDLMTLYYPFVGFANDFTLVRPWVTMPAGLIDRAVDVWDTIVKWARDGGLDLRFNHEGLLELSEMPASLPDPSTETAWEFHEGSEATLLSLRSGITADDTYNHTVVYSQGTDGSTPVFAEASVTDTEHPLYVNGPMGDIPFFYSSNMIQTTQQAQAVADALLYKHLGYTTRLHFNSMVIPCLEDGDPISAIRAKSKINSLYTLDRLTIPMTSLRAMECDTRERFINVAV